MRAGGQSFDYLFLFSDTGGGHRAGAEAVREACEELYGDAVGVTLVDVFRELGRWPFPHFPEWYPAMVGLRGVPWQITYQLTNGPRRVRTLARLSMPYTARPCQELLKRYPADVIVSFHAAPNPLLTLLRHRVPDSLPLVTVALDLVTVHAAWFSPGQELYLVPTEEARERARRWCRAPHRIRVVGMPTRRRFRESMSLPQAEARRRLGLGPQEPLVLFLGGGQGIGPLESVIRAVLARRPAAQLAVIAGRNADLRARLMALAPLPTLRVEGFVTEMELWLRAADIVVTKAGPNTLAETFIAGRPLVLYGAIPGQETGNVTYVQEHGAGIWAPRPEEAAAAVVALLNTPARRQELAARARALARPDAALDIARQLWHLAQA